MPIQNTCAQAHVSWWETLSNPIDIFALHIIEFHSLYVLLLFEMYHLLCRSFVFTILVDVALGVCYNVVHRAGSGFSVTVYPESTVSL